MTFVLLLLPILKDQLTFPRRRYSGAQSYSDKRTKGEKVAEIHLAVSCFWRQFLWAVMKLMVSVGF